MRIVLSGWFWGQTATGSGQYLSHLLAHLPEAAPQHEYVLVVPGGISNSRIPDHASRATHHAPRLERAPTPFDKLNANLSKVWFEQIAFPRACRRLGANLAHVPHWGSPLRPTVPTVVTIHDLIPLLLPAYRGGVLVRLYTRLVAAAARRTSAVITVSQASQSDIITHLRLPAARVRVTHEAAPASFRRAEQAQVDALRRELGLPDRFFLYLGGFDVRKNVAGLLAAFAQVAERMPVAPALVIAGKLPPRDTAFAPDPRRIARELGIESKVYFTGWVEEADKPALYTAAVAFVFPSHYEGFGLPVLEALACGTPTITSNVSSLPEMAGQAAVLVSPDDVAGLAAAMARLWHDAAWRERLRDEALAQAAHFSWKRTAQATVEVYAEVLARAQAR
ncbi:MAG: glycosyltransferase family 4 protein [Chloroflexi bacterium]|nr:glycosyltransferase family 4 protein [Chloroflexota bacterium]